jgi:hypothetical protein
MLRWLRRALTDRQLVEDTLRREIEALEGRLTRRIQALEQRNELNEQALLLLGHRVARIDGRTSLRLPEQREPASQSSPQTQAFQ